MKKVVLISILAFFTLIALGGDNTPKRLKLQSLFGDNMVLQRNVAIPVSGTDRPQQKITVTFKGKQKHCVADSEGNWRIVLPAETAGGPFELKINGSSNIVLKNVMFGDVWLCAGQSNMHFILKAAMSAKKEIPKANYPQIRLVTIPGNPVMNAQKETKYPLRWRACVPSVASSFSAVAYFFGKGLYEKIKIPIGLISCSKGGTPIEAWMSKDLLENNPRFKYKIKNFEKACNDNANKEKLKDYKLARERGMQLRKEFYKKNPPRKIPDWTLSNFDDSQWDKTSVKKAWQKLPCGFKGAVDFRKKINLPEKWEGKDILLSLGKVREYSRVFFNGKFIGSTGMDNPAFRNMKRKYNIPGRLVKYGENIIALRIANEILNGGFDSPKEDIYIAVKDAPSDKIYINEDWKFQKELMIRRIAEPVHPGNRKSPSVLFNGMINPIMQFPIKGIIWYQGEANVCKFEEYEELLSQMILHWRKKWKRPDMPFIIVQLANFNDFRAPDKWAELRAAQASVARNVSNCPLVVSIDVGNGNNIHPRNKSIVGQRLVLAALKNVYGKNIVDSGPVFKNMKVETGKAYLTFENTGSGLFSKGASLKGFEISGPDQKFVQAKATILKGQVLVWNENIKDPSYVRYAWSNNPGRCNLYNKEGLPAVPFRTNK